MKCEKCGVELASGVKFCQECGNEVILKKRFCRECGAALAGGMKFCSECGARVERNTMRQNFQEPEDDYVDDKQVIDNTEASSSKRNSQVRTKVVSNSSLKHTTDYDTSRAKQRLTTSTNTSDFWGKLDFFEKIIFFTSVIVLMMFLIALLDKSVVAIFFAILQICGIVVSILIHRGYISTKYEWIRFLVYVFTIIFVLLGFASMFWGETKTESTDKALLLGNRDERQQKNGFDTTTNIQYTLGQYTVEFPSYWTKENSTQNGFQRYAETDGKTAMLQMTTAVETDDNYDVSFDGLMADNDNMIKMIERTAFKSVDNYEVIDTGNVKGILYSGVIEALGITGTGKCFAFSSEADRTWCTIILEQTDNTEYAYDADFTKIINSIKLNNVKKEETKSEYMKETTETSKSMKVPELTQAPAKAEVVLPKDGTKLSKDFDSKNSSSAVYCNVDGIKNIPSTKNWGSAMVTDAVAEYLDYLEDLGFKVEVTGVSSDSPYDGYTYYEAYITASNTDITWDMYSSVQDEDYVEYEFDIYMP